jgi:hypothetical protein
MSLCHHFIVATLTQITKIWANFARCNSVRVHPYAYPQLMQVLKHFSYIKYECGKPQWWSTVSTMSSCHHFIVATLTPICHNLGHLHRGNSVRVHPYPYPQHMKVLFHISSMNVGSSQWCSTALTMSSCHHFIVTLTPTYRNLGQLCQV